MLALLRWLPRHFSSHHVKYHIVDGDEKNSRDFPHPHGAKVATIWQDFSPLKNHVFVGVSSKASKHQGAIWIFWPCPFGHNFLDIHPNRYRHHLQHLHV